MNKLQSQQELKIEESVELLKAIAHPSRIQIILALLPNKQLNVNEIVNILQMPQPTVSQHLSKMKGEILRSDRRGLEVYYYISNPKVPQIIGILASTDK
ncbi:helix-turn-helix transcriptional regulator [Bacillus paramycoides]|uniref:ArsR/SmtB family transcription factor n=1 Tax=Bacillus paramycoides TaxID=2026194 RepID=UPI0015BB99F8|nr:metalloregulator ArsR/SmtB family transcription factor [Bacillus paramycoides]NWK72643.1 helix-turn-helix transcriptional regulator [Bacillus paramycoides]